MPLRNGYVCYEILKNTISEKGRLEEQIKQKRFNFDSWFRKLKKTYCHKPKISIRFFMILLNICFGMKKNRSLYKT